MKVRINGRDTELKAGATLKDAVKDQPYEDGSLVSVLLSSETIQKESNNFELVTARGSMTINLDDSGDAERFRSITERMTGSSLRWVTSKISAFGSFESDIPVDRSSRMYKRYECFFALGGYDNRTTYMMIAREDHRGSYGAGTGLIGRITRGRHILEDLKEGDAVLEIKPVVSEWSTDNVIVTSDQKYKLEDGMSIETYVNVELNERSPMTSEHVLVTARHGSIEISDGTGSYAACSDNTDVTLDEEETMVRDLGNVTVRNKGVGTGRVFFYRVRRQVIPSHNHAGIITHGRHIAGLAEGGQRITLRTVPERVLSVGMTQAEGEKFLKDKGVKQVRTGDRSDDAIIAEQGPEWTIEALKDGKVETFGVPREKVYKVSLDRKKAPLDCHYFDVITGLSHKPVGRLQVHFTFKGLPMITFEGDEDRGKSLYPGDEFKKCKKGDIGLTNQARPHHGLLGIRLQDSKEYGPTGEEPYGTNIFGRFDGSLDKMLEGLKDGDYVYVTEEEL